jgi:uncharacterized protein
MIPGRRRLARARVRGWQLSVAGAAVGFLTGVVLSTGPLSVPVFTGYGLAGPAFLGTEAASALVLYAAKMLVFGQSGVLDAAVVARGLVLGVALAVGPFLARPVVRRLDRRTFDVAIDAVLAVAGVAMAVVVVR